MAARYMVQLRFAYNVHMCIKLWCCNVQCLHMPHGSRGTALAALHAVLPGCAHCQQARPVCANMCMIKNRDAF